MMRCRSLSLILAAAVACAPAPLPPPSPTLHNSGIAALLLAAHNRERAAFGSPPLTWDPALAAAAQVHATLLASLGSLRHSPRNARPGQGENLWIGTRGAYPLQSMTGAWASERRLFRPGRFPAISRTGDWAAVGHYSQMVWPTTSRLGCALASSARWDVLVCRYSSPGNVDGVMLAPR